MERFSFCTLKFNTEYDQHFQPLIRRARPVVKSPGLRICHLQNNFTFNFLLTVWTNLWKRGWWIFYQSFALHSTCARDFDTSLQIKSQTITPSLTKEKGAGEQRKKENERANGNKTLTFPLDSVRSSLICSEPRLNKPWLICSGTGYKIM